ncbi:MAG: hypothetical protein ACRDHZ_14570 [Ktedonobacteraceae bacterium]
MNSKHAREDASSRFRFQHVSTSTREAIMVDTGCQRCQHCLFRRLRPLIDTTTSTSLIDPSAPSVK